MKFVELIQHAYASNVYYTFCDSCFKLIHDKQINSQHIKEKINKYIDIDMKCLDHPKVPINLFCVDEKGKI